MKKHILIFFAALLLIWGCSNDKKETEETVPAGMNKITVVEHMNGGGYTFLKGEKDGNELWVAIREMPVETGETYYFKDAMEMKNFESKSLNKTFASILFVSDITKNAEAPKTAMPGMAAPDGHTKPKVEAADIKVTPLEGGLTVEAVNKDKVNLAGKIVKVKGVVTKYNGGIMNRNWIHLQDGTKFGESVDITVTSDQPVKVGDTIVIEGTVALDKDFGAGYFYDVIVENAKITVDKAI
ncbi:MAG: DNA-binding protein [Ignavibacteriae bacterium]|nr:DNA-binding protein [Ignavibacteriota bacterium]